MTNVATYRLYGLVLEISRLLLFIPFVIAHYNNLSDSKDYKYFL